MRQRLLGIALIAAMLPVGAPMLPVGAAHAADGAAPPVDVMVQAGTYDTLTRPDFTGRIPIDEVLTDQTLGLGTFNDLDGELVLVGGVVYQVRPDGTPRVADRRVRTPFLQAVRFRPERSGPVPPGTTCAQLTPLIDALAGSPDGIVAVRVRGTFTDLVTRSVSAVPPPFTPLSEVVASQTVFPLGTTKAVLVGFRQGADAQGLGQPGLHLHGMTAARGAGGHVLSCVVGPDAQLTIQRVEQVRVQASRPGSAPD